MLRDSGLDVEALAPGVDEITDEPDPAARARALAARKADAVRAKVPDAVVIGADQVVTDGAEIWGKPRDRADHVARLSSMRGRSHDLVTGWAIRGEGIDLGGHERTRLWARADVTDDEIARYVDTGEGTGCAGGYAIEGRGVFLFERIEGDWFNIVGLPLLPVLGALRGLGWRFRAT